MDSIAIGMFALGILVGVTIVCVFNAVLDSDMCNGGAKDNKDGWEASNVYSNAYSCYGSKRRSKEKLDE